MNEIEDVYNIPGMLTRDEVNFLYRAGQLGDRDGVIVEIGSFKGKSTIALARGAAKVRKGKIYAIDPHRIQLEEGYTEDTEAEFLANIRNAGVEDYVLPLIMTSEEANKGWHQPIRLLWIDGDHRYEAAKLDFTLWEPFVVEGGIIAMHDTIRKKGPKRVLWENVFGCGRFQDIAILDNITAVRKVTKVSLPAKLSKWSTLALRAIYIAARKSHVPYSKPAGRWFLSKVTNQKWLPLICLVFSLSMAR